MLAREVVFCDIKISITIIFVSPHKPSSRTSPKKILRPTQQPILNRRIAVEDHLPHRCNNNSIRHHLRLPRWQSTFQFPLFRGEPFECLLIFGHSLKENQVVELRVGSRCHFGTFFSRAINEVFQFHRDVSVLFSHPLHCIVFVFPNSDGEEDA